MVWGVCGVGDGGLSFALEHSKVCTLCDFGHLQFTVLGGHQSRVKIENDLKRKFYWPHMKTTIKEHCQDCVPCAYNKRYPVGFPQGKLIVPLYPNHIVYMDVTGGLPLSYDGCRSLLLIFDGFSKFAFGIPLKSEKAAYVAKQFTQQYVQAFGVPWGLHSDNAPNMSGAILSILTRMIGCKKTETPSWCPRADPAETLVASVGELLCTHLGKSDQRMWTVILPFLINGLNATVSSSTFFTPAEIFLGRSIENTPILLLPGDHPEVTSDEWMMAVRRGQEYKYEIIRKRARIAKNKRKEEMNVTRPTHKFTEGKTTKTRNDPDWVIGGQHKNKPPRNPEESRLPTSAHGESERLREAERKLAKREKRERLKAENAQKEADLDEAIGPFSPEGTKQPKSPTSRKSTKASKKSTPASVTTGAKSHSLRDSQCSTTANESEEASATSHLPK
jgi:hypothetical protein